MCNTGWSASMPSDINAKFQSTAHVYVMIPFLRTQWDRWGSQDPAYYCVLEVVIRQTGASCFGVIHNSIFSKSRQSKIDILIEDRLRNFLFDSLQEIVFFKASGLILGPTQSRIRWLTCAIFLPEHWPRPYLTTHLHRGPGSRVSKAIFILPSYFRTFYGANLPFRYQIQCRCIFYFASFSATSVCLHWNTWHQNLQYSNLLKDIVQMPIVNSSVYTKSSVALY